MEFDPTFLTDIAFFSKVAVLIVLGMVVGFTVVIFVEVRTLNKIISQSFASTIVTGTALLLILAAVSLFFIGLAIL